MMTVDSFAIWKFKTVEGPLKNWRCSDFDLSKYDVDGHTMATIKYDIKSSMATVSTHGAHLGEHTEMVPFTKLVEVMKRLGLYEQCAPGECHSSALLPFEW